MLEFDTPFPRPLLLAFLVAIAFPETARRELEDLNPEDRGVP